MYSFWDGVPEAGANDGSLALPHCMQHLMQRFVPNHSRKCISLALMRDVTASTSGLVPKCSGQGLFVIGHTRKSVYA